jgi:single-stranded DNA-binding protein
VVVWQELAQRICREAKNGQAVYVEGSLHSRSFIAANGERKTVVEIYAEQVEPQPVFLPVREGRGETDGGPPEAPVPGEAPGREPEAGEVTHS